MSYKYSVFDNTSEGHVCVFGGGGGLHYKIWQSLLWICDANKNEMPSICSIEAFRSRMSILQGI